MAISLDKWAIIKSNPEKAIGEVFSINGEHIDVFIYPEFLPHVKIGDIFAIEVEWGLAVGIALNTSYRAQRSFRALKLSLERIKRDIPDIYRFHILLTRIAYTSKFEDGRLEHVRGGTPMLHSLAFRVESKDLLTSFFKPTGEWDLSFLELYINAGATPITVKHFFSNHREIILECMDDRDKFISELARVLRRIPKQQRMSYVEYIFDGLGWLNESSR